MDTPSTAWVRKASPADSAAITAVHLAEIPWGLLSGMGPQFVGAFYRTLLDSPWGFAFLAEREGRPVGFASGVVHWRRFYRAFVLRNVWLAARAVSRRILRGGLRRLVETSRYAAGGSLSEAELVSIAVCPEARGTGVADALVRAILTEFSHRAVRRVRVTTAGDNRAAARVYERSGFTLLRSAEIHPGEHADVYVIALSSHAPADAVVGAPSPMRRLVDLSVAGAVLVFAAPLFALVAAVNWISTRRVFFRQMRVGFGLRPFEILKFQTMIEGAAAGSTVTAGGDPRITPLGRVLRAVKLDELPQVINVMRGEMSLVGPRPLTPNEVAAIPPDLARRVYTSRPGMTGIAQLIFADEEELLAASPDPEAAYFETVLPEKVTLELAYAGRRTWVTDLAILMLTPVAGFSPRLARAAATRLCPAGPSAAASRAYP